MVPKIKKVVLSRLENFPEIEMKSGNRIEVFIKAMNDVVSKFFSQCSIPQVFSPEQDKDRLEL